MKHTGRLFEVILVNDGSVDGSWNRICLLSQKYSWVKGMNLARNYGQHNALLCGIRAAIYPTTVTMDDDLQNPPEEIPKLLGKLEEGFDVVYGNPNKRMAQGFWRGFASWVTKLVMQKAMGIEAARKISSFRAFRTRIREASANFWGPFVSIDVLLVWGASKFGFVNVRHDLRWGGKSNYTIKMMIDHLFNMVTGFTILPLQLASMTGLAFSFFGGVVLVYVLLRYFLEGGAPLGFPFLACTIAIFSGVQLLTLGIIGEYLARVHSRTMNRPVYMVKEKT